MSTSGEASRADQRTTFMVRWSWSSNKTIAAAKTLEQTTVAHEDAAVWEKEQKNKAESKGGDAPIARARKQQLWRGPSEVRV